LKDKLIALLEVRKIISLGIAGLFIALSFMGKIDPKLIEYVVTSVIAYYFAKATALDVPVQATAPKVVLPAPDPTKSL
jgi:hypothetical protein